MEQVKIFVEGETDKKFISDYLNYLNISFIGDQINIINGKSESHIRLQSSAFNLNALNLFVLDLDNDLLEEREKEIRAILSDYSVSAELFFYPNNSNSGTFEDLLKSMAWPQYADFFQCYSQLNNCITQVHSDFETLDKKDEVYAYLSALLTKEERYQRADFLHFTRKPTSNKPHTPSYMQTRFWNIESPAIQPLKQFLLTHLSA
ncbi:MAG: hypothetical protein MUC87_13875 [Bacteroidia bacterium]|jgi:hypothetical protein|nr:hypothetical protein [Bacteroidia bacterium]